MNLKRYRLYIDESGDHAFSSFADLGKRYLGITGIVVEMEYYRQTLHQQFEKLKQKHFPHSPDEPINLHRDDIVRKRGSFWILRNPEQEKNFNNDLLQFLESMDYKIISVVLDKKAHVERFRDPWHPYHYCLKALLERYCGFLNYYNAEGDVMAESRGGREDEQLKKAYGSLYGSGTWYKYKEFFQKTLTSKEIKIKLKSANIAGLQIADLLAHPCKNEILFERELLTVWNTTFGFQISRTIQSKYNRWELWNKVEGYGKIFID